MREWRKHGARCVYATLKVARCTSSTAITQTHLHLVHGLFRGLGGVAEGRHGLDCGALVLQHHLLLVDAHDVVFDTLQLALI